MKKDGFFASLLKATVEEEKKKYAETPPDIFTNQKKQMWYFLMNQVDSVGEVTDGTDTDTKNTKNK